MKRIALLTILVILLSITTINAQDVTLSYGRPGEVGMSKNILDQCVKLYKSFIDSDQLQGAVLFVAKDGKIVLHEAVGWRDKEAEFPMEKNTMFRMASNSKPLISTAIAKLVEKRKLSYDDLIRKYYPSFDNYKSGFIRIHHLLTHTAGFRIKTIFLKPLMEKSAEHPDAPNLLLEAARFGEAGPEYIPGTSYSYSNAGYNTLGALVETASGKSLEQYLDDAIYTPLGMDDSYNHEIAEKLDGKLDRMGPVYIKNRKRNEGKWTTRWKPGDPPDYPFVRASGGMISTAYDYAIFCQMFLNKGKYNGKRILREKTVELMTEKHATVYHPRQPDKIYSYYGYGWLVSEDGVYSHSGSDGTTVWIDPNKNLIGMVLTQSPEGGNPEQRFWKLVNAAIY